MKWTSGNIPKKGPTKRRSCLICVSYPRYGSRYFLWFMPITPISVEKKTGDVWKPLRCQFLYHDIDPAYGASFRFWISCPVRPINWGWKWSNRLGRQPYGAHIDQIVDSARYPGWAGQKRWKRKFHGLSHGWDRMRIDLNYNIPEMRVEIDQLDWRTG